jgi:hypothetical protein
MELAREYSSNNKFKLILMKRIIYLSLITIVIAFSSCQKKQDVGGTIAQKFANEWWVQLYDPTGALAYPAGYYGHMKTYNTSANDNTIWIDDFPFIATSPAPAHWTGDIWAFKFKATTNPSNLTFTATQAASDLSGKSGSTTVEYKIKVDVTEGKILENAGHSKTGVLTDSIYMKIKFSDDPTTIYTIRGHARTRFSEDDY